MNKGNSLKCPECGNALTLTENLSSGGAHDFDSDFKYKSNCIPIYDCSKCGKIFEHIELFRK